MDEDSNDFLLCMKVILRADVKGLGRKGDQKTVADGYAMNALFPKKLAVPATTDSVRQLEHEAKERSILAEKNIAREKALAKKISGMTITLVRRAEKGKLFGAIHERDIIDALAKEQITILKKQVFFRKQIREVGTHSTEIRLGHDVGAVFSVVVTDS